MQKAFRIAASLLIVALLIGVATDRVRAAAMTMSTPMSVSGDGDMPDCDGCDDDDAASGDCAIVCASGSTLAMALPEVAAAEFACLARTETRCMAFRIPPGMRAPPDPFPPKILVLN